MNTSNFIQNTSKAVVAFMSAAVMGLGFTASSQDDELPEADTAPGVAQPRGRTVEFTSYVERGGSGSRVEPRIKYAADCIELSGDKRAEETRLEAGKWYVVKSRCIRKTISAPKSGGAAHLIICDGATLTTRVNIGEGLSLNIYGQEGGNGRIEA